MAGLPEPYLFIFGSSFKIAKTVEDDHGRHPSRRCKTQVIGNRRSNQQRSVKRSSKEYRSVISCKKVLDYVAIDIRETEAAALGGVCEPGVIDPELV